MVATPALAGEEGLHAVKSRESRADIGWYGLWWRWRAMHFDVGISVEEAATALGAKPPTVRNLIKAGRLSASRFGRAWRVHTASVNALLAPGSASPANPITAAPPESQNPAPSPPPVPQANPTATPFFEPDDMIIIHLCERVRFNVDPDGRKLAAWILEKHRRFAHAVAIDRPPPEPITPRRFDLF